ILRTLNKTYCNLKRKPVWNDLNPKAVNTDELFGFIHPATRQRKDGQCCRSPVIHPLLCYSTVGLLSFRMREQGNICHPGPKWIVLDGDIDPMWIESLNTVMDDNKLHDYRAEFSQWWTKEIKTVKLQAPAQNSVFDIYLDPVTRRFLPWSHRVTPYHMEPDMPLQAVLVHTAETARLRYFMDLLLERGQPLDAGGNAGVGKTSLVRNQLDHLTDIYMTTKVPLNNYCTSLMLQMVLEWPLAKRAGCNFAPPGNRKLVYFIDDMNMPAVDSYGTVQPHTLIHQHLDYTHWYDRQKMTLKEIHHCQYVACMNPISGSFTINPRLQFDLTGLYLSTRVNNQPIALLVTDAQIPDERFLVIINNLLASGDYLWVLP
ncbi:unnamed protein product, partial [Coregonus sp. 'balchen']